MEIRDCNGKDEWAAESIIARYRRYCGEMGVANPLDLTSRTHTEGLATWIWPVMDQVIEGIKAGDKACVAIGIGLSVTLEDLLLIVARLDWNNH